MIERVTDVPLNARRLPLYEKQKMAISTYVAH
jgi:hypothetical protein